MSRTSKWYDCGKGRFVRMLTSIALLTFTVAAIAAPTQEVRFGVPNWPGEQVKAEVASEILDDAGYKTSVVNVSWIVALKSVALGQLDVDMSLWRPTQNSVLNPMLQSNKVKLLTTNIKDAKYDVVVPDYVWNAGVHSIADLSKYADKFDHKIYGIEAGNDGNELVLNAIAKNMYGLGDFDLVQSSEPGMLAQVGVAVKSHQWIAFLGWKPHWMNIIYKIKYLDDPKLLWGGASTVNTVANPSYAKANPNVVRFLTQMQIPAKVQSQWIYNYGYAKKPMKEVASQWIKANPDLVRQWLDGVTTADGSHAAIDAVH